MSLRIKMNYSWDDYLRTIKKVLNAKGYHTVFVYLNDGKYSNIDSFTFNRILSKLNQGDIGSINNSITKFDNSKERGGSNSLGLNVYSGGPYQSSLLTKDYKVKKTTISGTEVNFFYNHKDRNGIVSVSGSNFNSYSKVLKSIVEARDIVPFRDGDYKGVNSTIYKSPNYPRAVNLRKSDMLLDRGIGGFYVSPKVDGERVTLVINNFGIFVQKYNRKVDCLYKGSSDNNKRGNKFSKNKDSPRGKSDTIIEAELYKNKLFCFDASVIRGRSKTNEQYTARREALLDYVYQAKSHFEKNTGHKLEVKVALPLPLNETSTDNFFGTIEKCLKLDYFEEELGFLDYTEYEEDFNSQKVETDGLIFTENKADFDKCRVLKWKPKQQLTVDVLYSDGKFFDAEGEQINDYFAESPIIDRHYNKQIIEVNVVNDKFNYIRTRYDRPKPNSGEVIQKVLNDYRSGLTEDDITGKSFVGVRMTTRSSARHNIIKSSYFANLPLKILDIGFGRGGDINIYKKVDEDNEIETIKGVEPNVDNYNEALRRVRSLEAPFNIEVINAKAEDLPDIGTRGIGLVVMNLSLSFFYESEQILDKLIEFIDNSTILNTRFVICIMTISKKKLLEALGSSNERTFQIGKDGYSAKYQISGNTVHITQNSNESNIMGQTQTEWLVDVNQLTNKLRMIAKLKRIPEEEADKYILPSGSQPIIDLYEAHIFDMTRRRFLNGLLLTSLKTPKLKLSSLGSNTNLLLAEESPFCFNFDEEVLTKVPKNGIILCPHLCASCLRRELKKVDPKDVRLLAITDENFFPMEHQVTVPLYDVDFPNIRMIKVIFDNYYLPNFDFIHLYKAKVLSAAILTAEMIDFVHNSDVNVLCFPRAIENMTVNYADPGNKSYTIKTSLNNINLVDKIFSKSTIRSLYLTNETEEVELVKVNKAVIQPGSQYYLLDFFRRRGKQVKKTNFVEPIDNYEQLLKEVTSLDLEISKLKVHTDRSHYERVLNQINHLDISSIDTTYKEYLEGKPLNLRKLTLWNNFLGSYLDYPESIEEVTIDHNKLRIKLDVVDLPETVKKITLVDNSIDKYVITG